MLPRLSVRHATYWDGTTASSMNVRTLHPEMFPNASERINSKADEFLMVETPSSLARFSDILLLLGHDWAIDQSY